MKDDELLDKSILLFTLKNEDKVVDKNCYWISLTDQNYYDFGRVYTKPYLRSKRLTCWSEPDFLTVYSTKALV